MSSDSSFLSRRGSEPLAARMRPATLDEFVGQEDILGPGKLLRRAIEADQLSSIILWGPPGSGKTTLGHVIAVRTESRFLTLNAVLAGVKDIREAVAEAEATWKERRRRTILFVDEVHRFNKSQQDALLPHVENGTIVLIGATTENPYFEVIKPLVSRSRIFALRHLTAGEIAVILRRALADAERGYGARAISIAEDALAHLGDVAQGDARSALNALELAVETTPAGPDGTIAIDRVVAEESIQRRALLYDKDGDVHYDTVSAFIKSLRGSDPDAALYWMARMLHSGEDPRFIARRMLIFASEDVGLADPAALAVAASAAQAVEYVGMPECQFNLAEACLYLACAEKSNSAMAYFDALAAVQDEGIDEVPGHLKDPSRDKKGLGHGKGYKYPHAYREHWVPQQYLPDKLAGRYFFHPSDRGEEAGIRERIARLRQRKDEPAAAARPAASGGRPWEAWQERTFGKAAVTQRDRLLAQTPFREDMRVLDLCGGGLMGLGALLNAPLGRIVSLFGDAARARAAGRKFKEWRIDRVLRAVRAAPDALPFRPGAFDLVLALNPFSSGRDAAALLAEAARVLIAGGCLAFIEPLPARRRRLWQELDLNDLPRALAERVVEAEESLYRDPESRFALSEAAVSRALGAAGFEVKALDLDTETESFPVTPAFIERLFEPGSSGLSYGDRLRKMLSQEELEQVRRLIASRLGGRTLARENVVACAVARQKPPDA